jgi:hypothetical protein
MIMIGLQKQKAETPKGTQKDDNLETGKTNNQTEIYFLGQK